MMLLIFCLVCFITTGFGDPYPSEVFTHSLQLGDEDGKFVVFWKTTGIQPSDYITFELYAKTTGWVGFGISPNGGMPGADIVTGGVANGQGYLKDRYSTSFSVPMIDEEQNYELLSAAKNSTHTRLKFKRKLSTCDKDDWPINNDTVRIIWAMGNEEASGNYFDMHQNMNRGAKATMLLSPQRNERLPLPSDVVQLDFFAKDVKIPSDERTLYLCKIIKLPSWPKHHIVKYEPYVQPGNEPFLHHVLLYHCLGDMAHLEDKQEACFTNDGSHHSEMYKCTQRYLAGWAVGGDGLTFAENLGYPLFAKGESPFILLEIHYDNPTLVKNVVDNSGMRLYLTPTLRPIEIGSMTIGSPVSKAAIILPPKQKRIKLYALCDWKCTQDLPKDGINVITGFLHEHLTGIAVRLRHFRGIEELEPIFDDSHYDFNYQDIRYHPKPVKVLPNDTLMVECEFDTMKRDKPTFGGFSTADEMCLVFIDYYPKINNIFMCMSAPQTAPTAEVMNLTEIKEAMDPEDRIYRRPDNKEVGLIEANGMFDWGIVTNGEQSASMKMLQKKLETALYYEVCTGKEENLLENENDYKTGKGRKSKFEHSIPLPNPIKRFEYYNPCKPPSRLPVSDSTKQTQKVKPVDIDALIQAPKTDYTHSVAMDGEDKYWLFWKSSGDMVQFEINVRTLGWISMGISPNGAMTNSDLAIGWITDEGKVVLKDFHAKYNGYPILDVQQDLEILYGYKNNTHTVIGFRRAKDTCDDQDKVLSEDTLKILWAYNDNLPTNENNLRKHSFRERSSKSMFLFEQPQPAIKPPSDLRILDFIADNIPLPNDRRTYYMCMIWKLPSIGKWHVLGAVPVVTPGNEGVVHHLVLHRCNKDLSKHIGKHEPCFNQAQTKFSPMYECQGDPLAVWAVGGGDQFYPEDLGMPYDVDGDEDAYAMLEIHYDNPEYLPNIIDSSGVKLYMTQQYRQIELGQGVFGSGFGIHRMIIPPKQNEFTLYGYCPSTCTEKMNGDGMTIISMFPHSHLAGRKMRLKHFRNGIELPPIMADESYDFNYQETRNLPERRKVLPGDQLLTECVYDTSDRNQTTFGAFGSYDEMCFMYFRYYPIDSGISACLSAPNYDDMVLKTFNIETDDNGNITSSDGEGERFDHYLKNYPWTSKQISRMQDLQKNGLHTVDCYVTGQNLTKEENVTEVTQDGPFEVKQFYQVQSSCPGSKVGEMSQKFPVSEMQIVNQPDVNAKAQPPKTDFTHSAAMDAEDKYWLFWKSSGDMIQFEINVRTLGWVAMGISPNGGMTNSDLAIGWITTEGKVFLKDYYAKYNGPPSLDTKQDLEILYGYKNNTHTIIGFRRKKDTCDDQDRLLSENTLKIMWAYNDKLPRDENDIQKHEFISRGSKSMFLFDQPKAPFKPPTDLKIMDFVADNIPLPNDRRTYYMCMTWKLPQIGKWHIIGATPIITPGNEGIVHHMILHKCNKDLSKHIGKHEPCFDKAQTNFSPMYQCQGDSLGGWAVGGTEHFYPENLGMPFDVDGEENAYAMLEIHYDNPELLANVRDRSGMKIYMSQQYRQIELGGGAFGTRFGAHRMIIPPKQNEFTLYGYCPSSCTEKMDKTGMTIYSVFPHSHLAGRKMRLRHFRNKVELPPIVADESYDFNYQEARILKRRPKILPGDELISECVYDTSGRNQTTFGAFGTFDEMCFLFVQYYPKKSGIPACLSSPKIVDMLEPFNITINDEGMITSNDGKGKRFDYYMKNLPWSVRQTNKMRYLQKDGLHEVSCVWRNPKEKDGAMQHVQLSQNGHFDIKRFYQTESQCPSQVGQMSQKLPLLEKQSRNEIAQSDGTNSVSTLPAREFTHSVAMDGEDKYWLFWKSSGDSIQFEINVRTLGWVAMGISPNGGMTNSDLAIGWITTEGKVFLKDYYAKYNGPPSLDTKQDLEILYGYKNNTHTIIGFRRKKDTCDDQDRLLSENTLKIMWAYNDKLPRDENDIQKHEFISRGSKSMFLFDQPKAPFKPPTDLKIMDFVADNIPLPNDRRTYYMCMTWKLPQIGKWHIIGAAPIITPGNEGIVHHMILHKCNKDLSKHIGKHEPCFDKAQTNFSPMYQCQGDSDWMGGWAVGGTEHFYPENLGMPFDVDGEKNAYAMLEIHYDNPELLANVRDRSGMKIYMSQQYRQIELGGGAFGTRFGAHRMIIPPKQNEFTLYGYCPSSCTEKMDKTGMTIYSVFPHSHLAGRKMRLRHFRNKVELPPIVADESYDFNYQEARILKRRPKILPGDELISECVYDTSGRNQTTFGAFGTFDEMCFLFVQYYPKKSGIPACLSSPKIVDMLEPFNITINDEGMITSNDGKGKRFDYYMKNLPWSVRQTNKMRYLQKDGLHEVSCVWRNPKEKDGAMQHVQLSQNGHFDIKRFYQTESQCPSQVGQMSQKLPILEKQSRNEIAQSDGTNSVSTLPAREFTHSVAMDSEDKYWLFWKSSGDSIQFEINVRTLGWVAMGISPNGGMTNSDLAIGWITTEGKVVLKDFYARYNGYPIVDKKQDLELLYGHKNNTHTIIGFRRKKDTCDEEDRLFSENTLKILWAYNDNLPNDENDLQKHDFILRGAKTMFLFDQPKIPFKAPNDLKILNFTAENIPLPNDRRTYYMCMAWKLPKIGKWHIIGVGPVITPGNEGIVHHMILHKCTKDLSKHVGKHEPCFDKSQTNYSPMYKCQSGSLGAWAVGGTEQFYPDDMALPFNVDDETYPYAMLEIHYDNPELLDNVRDNSGMLIYMTQQYRPIEMGAGKFGTRLGIDKMIIPPRQNEFTLYGHCPSLCTEKMDKGGMTIYSVFPHSHLAGRKMRLRHFRNGIELPPIVGDDSYDFNYQEVRVLPKRRTILPGDELLSECVYQTSERNQTTFGAYGTFDEMCFVFFNYYPRNNGLKTCLSSPNILDMLEPFNIQIDQKGLITSSKGTGQRFDHYMKNLPWTMQQVNKMQYLQKDGVHSVNCKWLNSTLVGFQHKELSHTGPFNVKQFYRRPSNCPNSKVGQISQKQPDIPIISATATKGKYKHTVFMDPGENYLLSWTPNKAKSTVDFEMTVKTNGWIGFGISPNGGMKDADIVTAWVQDDGSVILQDRYATSNGFPFLDDKQDYTVNYGSKNGTHTVIGFSRSYDTCDPNDRPLIDATLKILWAYGKELPASPNSIVKHKWDTRGSRSLFLFGKPKEKIEMTPDIKTFEYKVNKVVIPSDFHTLYWCEVFILPKFGKWHIIGYEPYIEPGNEGIVHHMILRMCSKNLTEHVGQPAQCFDRTQENFSPMYECNENVVGTWAVGGETVFYPPNMGKALESDPEKDQFLMLEVHYDNANYLKNKYDSSGMRIFMTQNYRPVEIGGLLLGSPVGPQYMMIPPNMKEFTVFSYCKAECTKKGIPSTGIELVSIFPHSHLAGRQMNVRHFRDGIELPPILKDSSYDFNYQDRKFFNEQIKVLPGDEFVTECIYSTEGRNKTTFGAFGSYDEMCLEYIDYVPRNDKGLLLCMSYPNITEVLNKLHIYIDGKGILQNGDKKGERFDRALKYFRFTDEQSSTLQKWQKDTQHNVFCYNQPEEVDEKTGEIVQVGKFEIMKQTAFLSTVGKFYKEPNMCDSSTPDILSANGMGTGVNKMSSTITFTHRAVMDPAEKYVLSWKQAEGDTKSMDFEMTVRSTGWVAFGISPNGGMKNADIVIGWVDSNGKVVISDRYASDNGFPEEDKQQDYELLYGRRNETHTVIAVRRRLNTCDAPFDRPLSEGTLKIIYAWSDSLPTSRNSFAKHQLQTRGSKNLFLFDKPQKSMAEFPSDMKIMEFRAKNVEVPSDHHTLYMCQMYKIPNTGKQQIIRFEPIIQKGNEGIVHHMILYVCRSKLMDNYVDKAEACFDRTGTQFSTMYACTVNALAGWAIGGEGLTYDSNMGKPIDFKGQDNLYVMLEVHYDNSNYHKNVRDNSGMRLYVTKELRPIEITQLTIGAPVEPIKQMIPPYQKAYTTYVYCTAACTKNFPKDGVTIFSGQHHGHLAAVSMKTRLIRNGNEQPPILEDDTYDFNYQASRVLDKPIKLYPGDVIVAECTYNTEKRKTTTFGNHATKDEMCLHYLDYYPRFSDGLVACESYADINEQLKPLNMKSTEEGIITSGSGKGKYLADYLKDFKWTIGQTSEFQKAGKDSVHIGLCYWETENKTAIDQTIATYELNAEDADMIRSENFNLAMFTQNGFPKVKQSYLKPDVCKKAAKDKPQADSQSQGKNNYQKATAATFKLNMAAVISITCILLVNYY